MPYEFYDCLYDINETAHAVLRWDWNAVYTTLCNAYECPVPEERILRLTRWYIDERTDVKLFWGLVALANPDLFKMMYKRKSQSTTMIHSAFRYLLNNPALCYTAITALHQEQNHDAVQEIQALRVTEEVTDPQAGDQN